MTVVGRKSKRKLIRGGYSAILVALAGTFGCNHSKDDGLTAPALLDRPHFRIELVSQDAATRGKVISSGDPAKGGTSYTCTSQDAAVALIKITNTDGGAYTGLPQAVVAYDVPFAVTTAPLSAYAAVILKKGFSVVPAKVDVDIYAAPRRDLTQPPDGHVTFTKFAPPKRILSPPSEKVRVKAEQFAVAEYVEDRKYLSVRPTRQNALKGMVATVVAASFSGPFRRRPVDSPSFVSSQQPASPKPAPLLLDQAVDFDSLCVYGPSTDAVEVNLSRRKPIYHDYVLTYRGAKILERDGKRILWLPTTQPVGSISGYDCSVMKYAGGNLSGVRGKYLRPVCELHVNLNASRSSVHRSPLEGSLSFVDLTPSLAQMGVGNMKLIVDHYQFSTDVHPSGVISKAAIKDIPELKLRLRITTYETHDVQTIVLPVHVVKSDPKLFPPSIFGSHGNRGPSMPMPGPGRSQ